MPVISWAVPGMCHENTNIMAGQSIQHTAALLKLADHQAEQKPPHRPQESAFVTCSQGMLMGDVVVWSSLREREAF